MLPENVLALIAAAFPGQPIDDLAPTEGGFSHHTTLATIGGRGCVIKAASGGSQRADVRREARTLAMLSGHDLPAPQLLALRESDEWTVAIMAAVAGRNGIQLYQQPDQLRPAYRALGVLLARVHRAPIAPPDADLILSERFARVRHELPALGLEQQLLDMLIASLVHPDWQPPAARLVHGDAGLHNILWNGRISALIDWEWSGWGNPLLDIAWVCWTMRWRAVAPALWDVFLESYQSEAASAIAFGADEIRALALGQIAGILVRVHDQSAAFAEWLRRAEWTRRIEFPSHYSSMQ